jgi:AraC family transcriptional regulator
MNLNLDAAQATATDRRRPLSSIAASGRIYFWQSGSLWIGKGRGRSEWHEHHAHQLALALDGELRFRTDRHGHWTRFEAAIVPSHCPHQFEIDGATVAHLFVEPESVEGRMFSSRFGAPAISMLAQLAARESADLLSDALLRHADAHAMRTVARTALARLAGTGETAARPVDARVARALDYLRSRVRAPVSQRCHRAASGICSFKRPERRSEPTCSGCASTWRSKRRWRAPRGQRPRTRPDSPTRRT